MSTILESLYIKVLVTIVVQRESTLVHIELYSKKDVVDEVSTEFKTTLLNDEMHDFIHEYIKESPYFYISILDTSAVQGAVPTCEKNKLRYYYDVSPSEYKCFEKKWTFYTAKNDIYEIEHKYKKIGIDMIFSPFVLLANFFQDKINKNLALYALIQDSFISVAVFENSQLLYAQHLDMLIREKDKENEAFNEDYQRFTMIQSAVSHFYKDDKYESRFIENVYIADGTGVTNDLKKYLEKEMFFNVYVRQADLGAEVCELAKMELGL